MAFGCVWEYVHSSSFFNKVNTCTWHHCFLVAVEQIYNCNYSPPGWFSSTPCIMQDIPYIISTTYLIYYWIVLVMVPQLPPLPLSRCLTALADTIPSCPAVNGLDCTTCSFRLYCLVWSLSCCLKLPLWRGLQCHQGLWNLFHSQAYELGSCPILLPLMWLFFTLSWSIYCVCSALLSSQMHRPEMLIVQWTSTKLVMYKVLKSLLSPLFSIFQWQNTLQYNDNFLYYSCSGSVF